MGQGRDGEQQETHMGLSWKMEVLAERGMFNFIPPALLIILCHLLLDE